MTAILQVSFLSENAQISGTVFLPALSAGTLAPGIVLCQGFAATKEMLLPCICRKICGEWLYRFDVRL
jgi:hypothetical protein